MPLSRVFHRTVRRTRRLSAPARIAGALALVGVAFAARQAATPIMPAADGYPFIAFIFAVMLAALFFSGAGGLVATAASALLAAYFYLAPIRSFAVHDAADIAGIIMFLAVGCLNALIIETLHRALEAVRSDEHMRKLILEEYRHRTRNDLMSLVSVLLLRSRSAKSPEAKLALKEAADHALAMARVHTRLEAARPRGDGLSALVDTHAFICGLCQDLDKIHSSDGLRPVSVHADIEHHWIGSERAVQLGLVVNELVTNALKYAFPDDRSGAVRVTFEAEGDHYRLAVADDGVGAADVLPDVRSNSTGMGTRLLRGLASQLRGRFTRSSGPDGTGTVAVLQFPIDAPDDATAGGRHAQDARAGRLPGRGESHRHRGQ